MQPLAVHEHWHIDVSHLTIGGTFYYLCSIIDGASRYDLYDRLPYDDQAVEKLATFYGENLA